jgi:hypothetical protein
VIVKQFLIDSAQRAFADGAFSVRRGNRYVFLFQEVSRQYARALNLDGTPKGWSS